MIRTLFVFALALAGGPFFAWWWPAAPGLLAGFWKPASPARGFLAALIGGGAAWAAAALWLDARNGGLLSGRVAPLFHLPGSAALVAATAIAGGVTAGLGALLGARFRRFWASLHDALSAQAAPVPPEDTRPESSPPPPRPPSPSPRNATRRGEGEGGARRAGVGGEVFTFVSCLLL